jgi:hypothetical protein
MQLRQFVGYHSGTNNRTFLLLYEATSVGKWLQTVRGSLSKGQRFEDYSALWRYNHHFSSKSAVNHYPMTRGCKRLDVSRTRWATNVERITGIKPTKFSRNS